MFEREENSSLEALGDNDLVERARDKDEAAFHELAFRYLHLIRSVASGCKENGLEPDDLIQEGLLGLLNAVSSYNAKLGASFKTYAGVCIKNQIISAARSAGSNKNKILNSFVPLDDELALLAKASSQPETAVLSKEAAELFQNSIEKNLSELERNVLSLYLIGYSYEEISEKLSITSKACDNAMQRVRKKLKFSDT